MRKNLMAVVGGLVAFSLFGCGPTETAEQFGDVSGVEEIASPLTALGTAPVFATGTLTVVLASGETAIISKHAVSGNILVNDVFATGATAAAVKTVAITGAAGAETVILDFANGTFAPGIVSAPGITVAMGAGADVFKIRGVGTAVDTFTVGGTALAMDIAFNIDAFKDIRVTGSGSIAKTFSLGGGNDVFNALSGAYGTGGAAFPGALTVYGGAGDDTLTGGDGNDTFYGDLGNDTMNGGSINSDGDVYNGGGGTGDTVTYASRSAAVTITVGAGAVDGETATETDDIKVDVEIVRGGSGADSFTGEAGAQTFYGGAGNDTFEMGLLASTGAGADTVYGEAGTDTVTYAARLELVVVTMDLNAANDGNTAENDTVRDDVENFICPTAAVVCTLTGNGLDNIITGGAGADVLSGGAGDDTFIMGATAGIGAGADSIAGGAGIDKIDFSTYGAAVTATMSGVASQASKIIGLDVENLTCATATACTVTGNVSANRIVGSSALDTISSGDGDDLIETSGAADVVDCGDGSDILVGAGAAPVGTTCEL